jgi:hypothetical protein
MGCGNTVYITQNLAPSQPKIIYLSKVLWKYFGLSVDQGTACVNSRLHNGLDTHTNCLDLFLTLIMIPTAKNKAYSPNSSDQRYDAPFSNRSLTKSVPSTRRLDRPAGISKYLLHYLYQQKQRTLINKLRK